MNNSGTAVRNSIVAALGGFLFGFDTAVISGVEKSIQELWSLSTFWHGFTVSSALFGTVLGALIAGGPAEKYGRKKMLQAIGVLYLATSLATALTTSWEVFVLFRFLGGIGVGASSVVGPMYISEISPAASRGRLVALFQFNIVSGILIAFVSNYLLFGVSDEAWRWMLGVQAIPAALYFSLVYLVPESPRWLIKHGKSSEALDILKKIGEPDPDKALRDVSESLKSESGKEEKLFTNTYSAPIFYAVTIAFFNQMVGINAIMYYAPRIFEMSGIAKDGALLQSISIGLTNMIFTMLAITLIDKFGRKTLMIIGSFGIIVSLGLVSYAFFTGNNTGYSVMIYLIIFIAFFALSQGAVIWVFISEIFPNSVRSKGQTLGSSTHWVMAWIVSWVFPVVVEGDPERGGAIAFAVFAIVAVFQLIFAWRFMPETKGKSLEQIQTLVTH